MLKYLAGVAAACLALWPSTAAAAPAWEAWQSVSGAFDLGGPRSDGSLIVAGSAALYSLTPDGMLAPFARGPGGYGDDPGTEAYLAISPRQQVAAAGCEFAPDDVYILRLHAPIGVTRVAAPGDATGSFANLSMSSLSGIAFDTVGGFDHRLLVTGPLNGKTEVVAVDCTRAAQVITKTAPAGEGGIAVAPLSFGAFGGDLIIPDELSGIISAIAPDGTATQVVVSGLAHGQDTGVEGVGFVPPGFTRGGYVYYSDRATPGSPHAGGDLVLRLSSTDLVAAGVQDGDLLAATEGGASMIDVRCDSACHVTTVIAIPTTAHGEGHLVFTVNRQPSPTPSSAGVTQIATRRDAAASAAAFVAIGAAVLAALTAVALALAARRRRR
ncbi:MAG TPA: hypothetical protein VLK30_11565 [Candidatus Limnocylindrales bacterium]|nr:hypothetical protein [Candidatus Limnocylindrales bacterium]